MASKFGGAQAAKNQWVTQQNLARHKSILSYVHQPRAPKTKAAPVAKPQPPVDDVVVAEQPKTTAER